jgi:hypothetical protein
VNKLVRQVAMGGFLLLTLLGLPSAGFGQSPAPPAALPAPKAFVSNLDVRCYRIPNQPPLKVNLRLDHLNPYFVKLGLPFEVVDLWEPQDLCVPVYKETQVPPPDVLPFIKFLDWKCYGITGPSLDISVHLDQLNPVIVNLLGPSDDVIVREPQQLCVPVYKNNSVPTVDVQKLVNFLDVKCYRIESDQKPSGKQIRLTHLNPVITDPPEVVTFLGPPNPIQLCVPVTKNRQQPPEDVLPIIQYSDVLCYKIDGRPLNLNLNLTHLNPVLRAMGLPVEKVFVADSDKLCVPVAKNGFFPPG